MNILALDLGTHTGYAYNHGSNFFCGTWDLATPREVRDQRRCRGDRRGDLRVFRLTQHIRELLNAYPFDFIVFEDVQFSSSTMQTQLWASLRTAVWLADNVPNSETVIDCVPVGTLKKFAGHGGASKEDMAAFLMKTDTRFCRIGKLNPKFFFRASEENLKPIDDNSIDAVWIWKWAKRNLAHET